MTFPFMFGWPIISPLTTASCLKFLSFILGVICSIKNSTTLPFGPTCISRPFKNSTW